MAAMERKIKIKILLRGRVLGMIEANVPKMSQPNHSSPGNQFNHEEEQEHAKDQEDISSIKNAASLSTKKVASLPIKTATSLPIKKHPPSTMKEKDTTSSLHGKIGKVLHKIQKRNRTWRGKGIAYYN